MKGKSNATQLPEEDLQTLYYIVDQAAFVSLGKLEMVVRCHDCNQVLQVSSETTTQFLITDGEPVCLACNLRREI